MSRKSIILSLIALAVMLLGVGVAVLYLYSDMELPVHAGKSQVEDDSRHVVLSAVPSDASLVACFKDARKVAPGLVAGFSWPESVRRTPMAVSLHYSGRLIPLFIFETDENEKAALTESLQAAGLTVDGSVTSIVLASCLETLVKSSKRHLERKVSVMDAAGFEEAMAAVRGDNAVFISNTHSGRFLPAMLSGKQTDNADFFSRFSDWMAFGIESSDKGLSMDGKAVYEEDVTEFMTVLANSAPSSSSVASVLPSYTLSAVSLPMRDVEPYMTAYQSYMDTRQQLQTNMSLRKKLKDKYKVFPQDLMASLDVREVAVASFLKGGKVEKIGLLKIGNKDIRSIDTTISYPAMTAAVFGSFFACGGEESLYYNGWIVSGSKAAMEDYRKGIGYTLKKYLEDAGHPDALSGRSAAATGYFSFTEEPAHLRNIFTSSFLGLVDEIYAGAEIAPLIFSIGKGKEGMDMELDVLRLALAKTNEAVYERDTTVVVPKGPFKVKNSGTGKMNEFYQNSHLSICLREDGKDLWGVPFDKPLCGTAQTVDFFTNGKLQIIFGAGSRIYLIDRLGRYVNGFPLDLKKEILLGPDVYDFSGKRKYNIMVLHKDNTIEMYNLQGVKPASWKGISVKEGRIKSLPERIDLSGSTFWIVRTSVQTLIYPLYGGEPLTVFEGDGRIRPDSGIRAVDGKTVEFTCYDGKVRTHALK